MNYISSSSISVFPSALRKDSYAEGRFTSEKNLSGIVRSSTDKSTFIITKTLGTGTTNHIEFVIHGYYFDIDIATPSGDYYAVIAIDNTSGLLVSHDLDNKWALDMESNFKGLGIETSISGFTENPVTGDTVKSTESITYYAIKLFNYTTTGAVLNTAKCVKFDINSLPGLETSTGTISIPQALEELANAIAKKQDIISDTNKLNGSFVDTNAVPNAYHADSASSADSAGYASHISGGAKGNYSQAVYINASGDPTPAFRVYSGPTQPTNAQEGDIWLKY